MKKIISVLLVVGLILGFAGCKKDDYDKVETTTLNNETTTITEESTLLETTTDISQIESTTKPVKTTSVSEVSTTQKKPVTIVTTTAPIETTTVTTTAKVETTTEKIETTTILETTTKPIETTTQIETTTKPVETTTQQETTTEKPVETTTERPAQLSKADAIRLINSETLKASKGNYHLKRTSKFTENVNVGDSATSILNKIISGVVKKDDWPGNDNWGVNEVVGNFLGISDKPIEADVINGNANGIDKNYLLKGMSITENDIINYTENDGTFIYKIKSSSNPQRDNKSSFSHVTNDFVTQGEVESALKNQIGDSVKFNDKENSTVNYTDIIFKATLKNDKLVSLTISYKFNADLYLKASVLPIHGTGAAKTDLVYTNISY